jgi:hypothetical protein
VTLLRAPTEDRESLAIPEPTVFFLFPSTRLTAPSEMLEAIILNPNASKQP